MPTLVVADLSASFPFVICILVLCIDCKMSLYLIMRCSNKHVEIQIKLEGLPIRLLGTFQESYCHFMLLSTSEPAGINTSPCK